MANSLAETFIQDIMKQNSEPLSKSDSGWQLGMQLAQMKMQKEAQAQQLAQKKQELELTKFEKAAGWFDAYSKMPNGPAKQAFGKNFIPQGIQALGLQDKINPVVMEMMLKDSQTATGLISLIRNGTLSPLDLNNPEKIAKVYPEAAAEGAALLMDYPKEVGEAHQFALGTSSKEGMNAQRASAGQGRGQEIQGRFEQSQKTKLADKLTALGIPMLKRGVKELDAYIPEGLDGYKAGKIPGVSGAEGAMPVNRLSGKALKVRGAAQSIANQILKLRSGAAVTDGEASRTLAELGMVPVIGEGGAWTGLAWKGITSEDNFIAGMRRAKGMIEATENTFKNAYGPEVYNAVSGETMTASKGGSTAPKGDTLFSLRGRQFTRDALLKIKEQAQDPNLKSEIDRVLGAKR